MKPKSELAGSRAATLIQVVIALVIIFGFVALTVDYGAMVVRQRQLQTAADTGALAAGPFLSQLSKQTGDDLTDGNVQDIARAYGVYYNDAEMEASRNVDKTKLTVTASDSVATPFRSVLDGTSGSTVSAIAEVEIVKTFQGMKGLRPLAVFAGPANGYRQNVDIADGISNITFKSGEAVISFQQPKSASTKLGYSLPGNKPAVTSYNGTNVNYYIMAPMKFPPGDDVWGVDSVWTNYRNYIANGYDGTVVISTSSGTGDPWHYLQMFFNEDLWTQYNKYEQGFSEALWIRETQEALKTIRSKVQSTEWATEGPTDFSWDNPRVFLMPIVNRDKWPNSDGPSAKIIGFTAFLIDLDADITNVTNPAVTGSTIPAIHGWFVPYPIPEEYGVYDDTLPEADEFVANFRLIK